jgi:hypothetical protein
MSSKYPFFLDFCVVVVVALVGVTLFSVKSDIGDDGGGDERDDGCGRDGDERDGGGGDGEGDGVRDIMRDADKESIVMLAVLLPIMSLLFIPIIIYISSIIFIAKKLIKNIN